MFEHPQQLQHRVNEHIERQREQAARRRLGRSRRPRRWLRALLAIGSRS
jgi:hypothetical protein